MTKIEGSEVDVWDSKDDTHIYSVHSDMGPQYTLQVCCLELMGRTCAVIFAFILLSYQEMVKASSWTKHWSIMAVGVANAGWKLIKKETVITKI